MAGARQPDENFAVQDFEEYQPVDKIGVPLIRVRIAAGPGTLRGFASHQLGASNAGISCLLIIVHGALRNAADYFGHARRAAELAGASGHTMIVAPQFLADADMRDRRIPEDVLYWDVDGWKGGMPSLGQVALSSFSAMDALLRHLTRETWPSGPPLAQHAARQPAVVLAGNSAGGQFVNRYAIVGREPKVLESAGIAMRFIIANPSSYLYFPCERPAHDPAAAGVNQWRYGFDNPPDYVDGTPEQYLEQYLSRDVSILLGVEDDDPAALLLEVSPAAMAQGSNRLERGIRYHEHVEEMARRTGKTVSHRLITLAGVGHDAGDVLTGRSALGLLFGY